MTTTEQATWLADWDAARGNMTASGPSLRAAVQSLTGVDPLFYLFFPVFRWSNSMPCDDCGVCDSTVVLNIADDAAKDERLCYHCVADRVLS